ncbi:putative membrane protein YqjE [Geodermatophilus tzadiensis]|uniref:Putative membrane protein YqjE n=1 Tax=Geodermatophilus tzadiensis TaxID=1137988 RepID=A0A2T0TRI4_9ACTN|nr:phage holin family protein [Geodermatophilus tzadiensis]PRY48251.1 putative membrane protein YqjE [Geodermatophilus tzadiensis]
MAHSVSSSTPANGRHAASAASAHTDPSVGALVQSAMADVSTLVRSEIELAKAEVGRSAKKAGVSVGLFAVAGVLLAFAGIYLFVSLAEALTALGLPRWVSYLIVAVLLLVVAGLAGLVGLRMLKRIDKPERTLESLRELPEVMHREEPGQRRRALPTVSNGRVERRGPDTYLV